MRFQDYSSFAVYGAAGLIMVVSAIVRNRFAKARERAAVAFAAQENFRFAPGAAREARGTFNLGFDDSMAMQWALGVSDGVTTTSELIQQLGPALPQSDGYEAEHVLVKSEDGRDWVIMDYATLSRDSKGNRSSTDYGVVLVRVPYLFKWVELRPENVFYRIGHAFGVQEIDFEVEAFNRKYHVTGQDRRFAFNLLSPRTIDVLMRYPSRHWEFGASFIVILRKGNFDYMDALRAIEEMKDVLGTIEPFLKQDYGFTPKWQPLLESGGSR